MGKIPPEYLKQLEEKGFVVGPPINLNELESELIGRAVYVHPDQPLLHYMGPEHFLALLDAEMFHMTRIDQYPELGLLSPEQLIESTLADLRALLGVKGRPVYAHTRTCPKAIPQYNVGYGKYPELLNSLEAKAPGLLFAGSYRDGVSLGDLNVSGVNIAERVDKLIRNEQSHSPR